MMPHVKQFFLSFMPAAMQREIKELYASTMLLNFGIMMIQLFEPIYLYTLGYSLKEILIFFLIVYVAYFLLMPLGARFAKRFGYEHSIIASTFVFIAYYYFFYSISWNPAFFYIAPLLYAVQKTLYWPAFHADFARYSVSKEDGREISGIVAGIAAASVVAPILAGTVLEFWGFPVLFVLVSVLFVASNLPLISTREVFVPQPFRYADAYWQLFDRDARRVVLRYMGFGEELVALVIWPVFMIIIMKDFLSVGLIAGVGTLAGVVAAMWIGKISDKGSKQAMLRAGTILYTALWFLRVLIARPFSVFLSDAFSRIGKEMVAIPLVALTYERAKERHVMHTILLFEMSLVLGKIAALVILSAVVVMVPLSSAFDISFMLGGFMTLLYGLK